MECRARITIHIFIFLKLYKLLFLNIYFIFLHAQLSVYGKRAPAVQSGPVTRRLQPASVYEQVNSLSRQHCSFKR